MNNFESRVRKYNIYKKKAASTFVLWKNVLVWSQTGKPILFYNNTTSWCVKIVNEIRKFNDFFPLYTKIGLLVPTVYYASVDKKTSC